MGAAEGSVAPNARVHRTIDSPMPQKTHALSSATFGIKQGASIRQFWLAGPACRDDCSSSATGTLLPVRRLISRTVI